MTLLCKFQEGIATLSHNLKLIKIVYTHCSQSKAINFQDLKLSFMNQQICPII